MLLVLNMGEGKGGVLREHGKSVGGLHGYHREHVGQVPLFCVSLGACPR